MANGFENLLSKLFGPIFEYFLHKPKVRFEKLQELRAKAIPEIYSKLKLAETVFKNLVGPHVPGQEFLLIEKWDEANKAYLEFKKVFDQNQACLNEKTCKNIDEYAKKLHQGLVLFRPVVNHYSADNPTSERQNTKAVETWEKAWEIADKTLSKIRGDIIKDFRDLLGVEVKEKDDGTIVL